MRDNFAKQLDELYVSVKDMGILCEKAIEKAAKTLLDPNSDDYENKEARRQLKKDIENF